MKVLMITEKDAANQSLSKIADAFLKKGHSVVIYALYFQENVLYMFDKSIEKHSFAELDDKTINEFDIIFATVMFAGFIAHKKMLFIRKPIFTQNYLINKQSVWTGDVCFVPSHKTVESEYGDLISYIRLEIGEPKYDIIKKENNKAKKFLFIDSGHYPFGEHGKRELAKTLLRISRKFPDYELVIKPRFLPGDKVITHKNDINLFDVLKDEAHSVIPDNIIMLTEHRDLAELIDECHTVICMYTTAFTGAYVAGKGLLVLDGLPSEDIYDVRMKSFLHIRENMLESGAVVNYHDAENLLPDGVKCSEEYLDFLLAETENVSDKICEATEYIYVNFFENNKFPEAENYSYSDFKIKMSANYEMTWEKFINVRLRKYLMHRALIHIDFHVNASLDIAIIKERINKIDNDMDAFNELIKNLTIYRSECIVANYETMLKDDIDKGVLLNALYLLKKYDEIKKFQDKNIGAYYLFNGFISYENGIFEESANFLGRYFKLVENRKFIKEVTDMSNNRFKAFFIYIYLLCLSRQTEKAALYLEKLKRHYINTYFLESFDDKITNKLQKQHYTYINQLAEMLNNTET